MVHMTTNDVNGIFGKYSGIPIIMNPNIGVIGYVPKRTHKKNRINKKWRKRYGYKPWYEIYCVLIDNCLYMNPYTLNMLKKGAIPQCQNGSQLSTAK
jgi:hypothetical protein